VHEGPVMQGTRSAAFPAAHTGSTIRMEGSGDARKTSHGFRRSGEGSKYSGTRAVPYIESRKEGKTAGALETAGTYLIAGHKVVSWYSVFLCMEANELGLLQALLH